MLKNYKIIQTEDLSETLYSEEYDETCHNITGAKEETIYIYLEGCALLNQIQLYDQVKILEVGFGTGLGYELTYHFFKDLNCLEKLNFISLEKDSELIAWSKNRLKDNKIDLQYLRVFEGDARQVIKDLIAENITVNCIYQDAFSPRKNPDLWSVEWFTDLKRIANNTTIMSTYSASSKARKSMIEAGWVPKIRDGFKGKNQSTIATIHGEISPALKEKLAKSHVDAIYDKDLRSF